MVYNSVECNNDFIQEALETIGNLNNIALENYNSMLMEIKTQQREVTSIKPYLYGNDL